MYTSNNPDLPYAGEALERHISKCDVNGYGLYNRLLTACGFDFVGNTFGDKLYRHTTTGEVIRMKYINRDAYQIRRERAADSDFGYLQHGEGTEGPFRTERVAVRNEGADNWKALFEGKWRKVHIQVRRTYIVYQGERITIRIDGV